MFFALEPLAKYLIAFKCEPPLNWCLAVILIWLIVFLMMKALNITINMLFRGLGLTWIDHILGGIFGAIRGALLAWLVIWALVLVLGPDDQFITGSKTRQILNQYNNYIQDLNIDKSMQSSVSYFWPHIKELATTMGLPSQLPEKLSAEILN